uniref:AMP-dependent synthetase/ligase domain-containing protein n=1 Tax=Photinus pyralis TaxID=7054 RepID=A0A1Y1KAC5_PHOPY
MEIMLNGKHNDNIIYTPNPLETPDPRGVGYEYFKAMERYRERIAQVDGHTNKEETYESFLKRCVRTAITMKNRGIKPGDFVSMCTVNDMDACVVYIAAIFIGAITANVDPSMSAEEIVFFLRQVSPKMVFARQQSESLMEEVVREFGGQLPLVVFGGTKKHITFTEFLQRYDNENDFRVYEAVNLEETVFVSFSSGTTSSPKAICHTHSSMRARYRSKNDECKTYAVFYSPCRALFKRSVHETILNGFRRILFHKISHGEPWKVLNYKVDYMLLSPVTSEVFLKYRKPPHFDLGNLRLLLIGGNYASKEFLLKLKNMFPKTIVRPSYGQSEIFSTVAAFPEDHRTDTLVRDFPTSIGLPREGFSYKVVDAETEEILGPNRQGELRLKTKYLMKGYLNYESPDLFDSDGWYRTGDLAYYNEHRCFFITGRLKDTFKYGNNHVYPREIEEVLLSHRSIQNAAVLGVEHEVVGFHPIAVVKLNDGEECVTPEEIIEYVDQRVEDKNRLRGGVKFVKEFPWTPTHKIQKSKLREWIAKGII